MTESNIHFKIPNIPNWMVDGEKFIKWDDDSVLGIPVTLKVDKYGFYLQWTDQNNVSDVLDLSFLRDTRTEKNARIPKDQKLKQMVTIGNVGTLEQKTLTIVYGTDFVNLSYINFCSNKMESVQLWCDELFKLAYNREHANASAVTCLLKAYTKLTLILDKNGKIRVKNIMKMFSQNKEEAKRIETALNNAGLPSDKRDSLAPSSFSFEDFFTFYKHLVQRHEVEKIFNEICANNKRKLMSVNQFVDFINKTQRDPRLNEILYPYVNGSRAKDLIEEYERNKSHIEKGLLSFDGFLRYIMSDDNSITTSSVLELSEDMNEPLAHYYVNSSHNTYLTGYQVAGRSSVEMYRQCLLAGCRCVELDFWNGKTGEPVIVHGYTLIPEIPAKDVIEAIAETAFKTSEYPVILSFENHCEAKQQAKIAKFCRDAFGDMLLDVPLESHKLEPGVSLPSPLALKGKIIIKNKKQPPTRLPHNRKREVIKNEVGASGSGESTGTSVANEEISQNHPAPIRQCSQDGSHEPEDGYEEDDEISSSVADDDEDISTGAEEIRTEEKPCLDKSSGQYESEAGAEISALVNYVQPVHFTSFEDAEKTNRSYEMSSFDEKVAASLLKEQPLEFVNYNKRQLSRVYPAGTRIDSSNFMPQVFWNAGCQLVAINYQTLDVSMQLNLGIFEYNQRCGYLLKPEFLRRHDRCFDPFTESTVDGIIAGTVSIHILSGQFLSDKKVGTYVEVEMYGLPADTVRKKWKTKTASSNGINPVFDEEPFVFKKVVLPELACIRIAAYEEPNKMIGHRVLPVVGLCPGYRHIGLRNESGQTLPMATLFVHVVVKDYVPDDLSVLAEALANPIKFQSELERRAKQLAVLMDDNGTSEDGFTVVTTSTSNEKHGSCPNLALPDTLPIPPLQARLSVTTIGSTKHETSALSTVASPLEEPKKTIKSTPHPSSPTITDELVAESLESLMESRVVKEKKAELEKKLETHRRKFEKEKRLLLQKSSQENEKSKMKFTVGNRLIKRLSIKTIDSLALSPPSIHDSAECQESDVDIVSMVNNLSRTHSDKLISIYKANLAQEREIREKYHDIIYSSLEKVMQSSQLNQLKALDVILKNEKDAAMRRLDAHRRDEVKIRSKNAKDKDEIGRITREASSSMVSQGVNETMRLTQIYNKQKQTLEKQHQEVRQQFEEIKIKDKNDIINEFEEKMKTTILSEATNDATEHHHL